MAINFLRYFFCSQNVPIKRKKFDHHNGINGNANDNRGPRGDVCLENNCTSILNGDICNNGDVTSTNGCASVAEVKAAYEKNGTEGISPDECMTLVMTCDEEPAKYEPMSDDDASCPKMNNDDRSYPKLSNGDVNGKSSPPHLLNGNGSSASESVPVRRSNRSRRGNKTVEITVSSSLTLKEVKKKVGQQVITKFNDFW